MGTPQLFASDQALLEAVQLGDRSAFESLVRKYQNLLTSVAYSGTGDLAQSEDIAQQAFLIAWEKKDEISNGNRIGGWLCGVVKNLVRNDRRKNKVIQRTQGATLDEIAEPSSLATPSPERVAIAREQQALLWSVLEGLPENYREPLILFYRENQSVELVADKLEISVDAVKQRLVRGRAMVRDELQQFVEDALFQTQPSPAFVMGVMSALPTIGAATGSAVSKGAASAATVWTTKNLAGTSLLLGPFLGILGAVLGTVCGILGARYGVKKQIEVATSDAEKKYVAQFGNLAIWVGLIFAAIMIAICFIDWQGHVAIPITVAVVSYCIFISWFSIRFNTRIRKIKLEHGTIEERAGKISVVSPELQSPNRLMWASLLSTLSLWVWLLVFFAISQAWLTLVISGAYLVVQSVYVGISSRKKTTVKQQANFMINAVLLSSLTLCIALAAGWDELFFAEHLPSYFKYLIPIVVGTIAFGFCLVLKKHLGNLARSFDQ